MSAAPASIPPELQQFIARYVRSVEQVEILCLFSTNAAKVWTAAEILRTIQSSEKSIADCLESFRNQGLLTQEPDGAYRLAPNTPELARLVSELATAYRERRVAIVESIYGRPTEAMQDFADAFKLRKGK